MALTKHILSLLRTPAPSFEEGADVDSGPKGSASRSDLLRAMTVAVLTPYSRQVQLLKQTLPPKLSAIVSTIDGFQGREGDVIVFSTVRCNVEGDVGFVEDERRLNVARTRPKLGIVIIGDRRTLETNSMLWRRALNACTEVVIPRPEVM